MDIDPTHPYAVMQRNAYEKLASEWNIDNLGGEKVVGHFHQHNVYEDYELLFKNIESPDKIMLDFGCGPGRNLVKYHGRFARIDGVDISQNNLDCAVKWLNHNGITEHGNLYRNDGLTLTNVPPETYDIVMSVITMQHISVYEVRYSLFQDMFRVLKTGGWITIQMGYGPGRPAGVDYYSNNTSVEGTNGNADVLVTDPNQLKDDLEKMGYRNFSYEIRPVGPGDLHTNWIFFRAQKVSSEDNNILYDTTNVWRALRYEFMEKHYVANHFMDKTVLEVGAAWGHIGSHFLNVWKAKEVTCTDHFQGWVDIISERHPNIKSYVQNINDPWPTDVHYDVLIHMGVLYHQPPELVEVRLREACSICTEMILETAVDKHSNDPNHIQRVPQPPLKDLWEPIATEYCLPSVEYVSRILTEAGMRFTTQRYAEDNRCLWFCEKIK